jgi:hypothetical protein
VQQGKSDSVAGLMTKYLADFRGARAALELGARPSPATKRRVPLTVSLAAKCGSDATVPRGPPLPVSRAPPPLL